MSYARLTAAHRASRHVSREAAGDLREFTFIRAHGWGRILAAADRSAIGRCHTSRMRSQVSSISLVGLLLAVGAGALHAVVSPSLTIADVHPNLALVATVLVATLAGAEVSVSWAFASGLSANLLVREPLGAIPLGLLLAVGATRVLARLVPGPTWPRVLAAAAIGSLLVDGVSLVISSVVGATAPGGDLGGVLIAAALLNAGLTLAALAPVGAVMRRFGPERRSAW